jgi:DNA-binding transcriptional LysR family regulator
MASINLDIDILRTLVMAQRLGGFARAAEQVGRSQSAVSQQIHKLEDRVGLPLFRKLGRGLELTEAGVTMLAYARKILELNDEAVTALRGAAIDGVVRFGLCADFAEVGLPAALGRFKRAHPAVRVEVIVDRNYLLLEKLDRGQLDLVLSLGHGARADAERIAQVPLVWIGQAEGEAPWTPGEAVPLALFEAPCFCRSGAIDSLDGVGTPWRVTFTSPSLPGLLAAVAAGLGVTVRTPLGMPPSVAIVGPRYRLPPLHQVDVSLHAASGQPAPAALRFKEIVREVVEQALATARLTQSAA